MLDGRVDLTYETIGDEINIFYWTRDIPLQENIPARFLDNLFADGDDNDVTSGSINDAHLMSKISSFILYFKNNIIYMIILFIIIIKQYNL